VRPSAISFAASLPTELASLYRERAIARAHAAERDPTTPLN